MGLMNLPASGTVYLDANCIIYSVEGHPIFWPMLEELWNRVAAGTLGVLTSELSVLETLVIPLRNNRFATVSEYNQVFAHSRLKVVPVAMPVLRAAAELRARHTGLKTPDAIHAATAMIEGCEAFITSDRSFGQITSLPLNLLSGRA